MIEDVIVVTSPMRRYLKLDWQQLTGFFGVNPKYLRYISSGNTQFSLLDFTSECEVDLQTRALELGMQLRFTLEYCPRLEEDRWQRMNNIQRA